MSTFDRASSSSSSTRATATWFVAVSRESKDSESVLRWALDNLKDLGGTEICILHVHRPDKFVNTGMARLPVASANERQISFHRAIEREKLSEKLDKYLQICQQRRVNARKIYKEIDSVEEGIVKLLNENKVGKLIMGASSVKTDKKGAIEIRPEKSNYVNKHAPSHVKIWFICNKLLIYTREGNERLASSPPQEVGRPSSESSSFVEDRVAPEPGEMWSPLPSAPHSPFSTDPESYDPDNVIRYPHIFSPSVSMPRRPRDREVDGLYMAEFESLKNEKDKISEELEATRHQKWILEKKVENFDVKVKELEQKLELSTYLGESYKKDRDAMQRERDNAIRHVEEVRTQCNEGTSSLDFLILCHEFTFLEIDKATKSFDPSLKIGEDTYGNIYKGAFHLTEVDVKIPHPNSSSVSQDFRQEVEILCELRHQNIVNLIGICLESHALVYEHCARGTLEDQLNNLNKDQGSPFPWQIRVRIASELSTVLAFLHSQSPNPVIHGDLRPENIHLDPKYTCKLNGFKISKAISNGEFSLETKSSFYRGDSEGQSYPYMDPEFVAGGDLTMKSDVYALGVILLRLLTGKPAMRLAKQVQNAVENDRLSALLDPLAEWPVEQAKLLAELALRCCEMSQSRRPDLEEDVWKVLESGGSTVRTEWD